MSVASWLPPFVWTDEEFCLLYPQQTFNLPAGVYRPVTPGYSGRFSILPMTCTVQKGGSHLRTSFVDRRESALFERKLAWFRQSWGFPVGGRCMYGRLSFPSNYTELPSHIPDSCMLLLFSAPTRFNTRRPIAYILVNTDLNMWCFVDLNVTTEYFLGDVRCTYTFWSLAHPSGVFSFAPTYSEHCIGSFITDLEVTPIVSFPWIMMSRLPNSTNYEMSDMSRIVSSVTPGKSIEVKLGIIDPFDSFEHLCRAND